MRFALAAVLVLVSASVPVDAQSDAAKGTIAINDIVARMNDNEKSLADRIRMYHPLMEVYVQHVVADAQLGWTPATDDYFLGQFDLTEKPRFKELNEGKKTKADSKTRNAVQFLPDGFAASTAPDWNLLTPDRYEFAFVRREVLGQTRCFVFDITPRASHKFVPFQRGEPEDPFGRSGVTGPRCGEAPAL